MKKLLLAAVFALLVTPAYADLVLFDNPFQSNAASANEQSLVDVGGIGFGARPRILTLQESPHQAGSSDPTSPTGRTGDAIGGANKSDTPTLGALNWGGASQVAIGYDSNQTGGNGITINQLTLSLYDANNTFVDSFSYNGRIQYTENDLDLQQGNGTGLFIFVLDAAQRLEWNALNPTLSYKIGLYADMGCGAAPCYNSDDGADSFIAIAGRTPIINPECPDCVITPVDAVPGPLVGAGIPGLIAGCLGLLGLARRRRQNT